MKKKMDLKINHFLYSRNCPHYQRPYALLQCDIYSRFSPLNFNCGNLSHPVSGSRCTANLTMLVIPFAALYAR